MKICCLCVYVRIEIRVFLCIDFALPFKFHEFLIVSCLNQDDSCCTIRGTYLSLISFQVIFRSFKWCKMHLEIFSVEKTQIVSWWASIRQYFVFSLMIIFMICIFLKYYLTSILEKIFFIDIRKLILTIEEFLDDYNFLISRWMDIHGITFYGLIQTIRCFKRDTCRKRERIVFLCDDERRQLDA